MGSTVLCAALSCHITPSAALLYQYFSCAALPCSSLPWLAFFCFLALSFFALRCLALGCIPLCFALPCPALPLPALPCLASRCPPLFCTVPPCFALPYYCPVLPLLPLSCAALSCFTLLTPAHFAVLLSKLQDNCPRPFQARFILKFKRVNSNHFLKRFDKVCAHCN